MKNAEIERLKASKQERLEAADRQLSRDVQQAIELANEALEQSEFDAAKKQIRRASLLDVYAKHSEELVQVIARYHKLERNAERAKVLEVFETKLHKKQFDLAEKIIEQGDSLFGRSEIAGLKEKVEKAKERILIDLSAKFTKSLSEWDIESAESYLSQMKVYAESEAINAQLKSLNLKKAIDHEAREIAKQISAFDHGRFSTELNTRLASALPKYPDHPSLIALKKKLEAYLETIAVPGDFADLEEALLVAPQKSHIRLGKGVFFLQSIIDKELTITGAGPDLTIIEGQTLATPLLQIKHTQGTFIMEDLQLRGLSTSQDQTQSLVHINAASVVFRNVRVTNSSGHGIEVKKGSVVIENSQIQRNSSDGIAIHGEQSQVNITGSQLNLNGGCGAEVWQGASLNASKCSIQNNAKAGAVVVDANSRLLIRDSSISFNTHSGVYVSKGASAELNTCDISKNAHSGIFAQWPETRLNIGNSQIHNNEEYGLLHDPKTQIRINGTDFSENFMGEKLLRKMR
ncbi:right-handed parallel beta-helix repeat-containing protein [Rubritalea spongiae]|uniref:right-handed parallel beta-helix repeat-containing protein n=1 Tax=Rubritalea spongiae TaxID=430797 RepID=UPI003615BD1D